MLLSLLVTFLPGSHPAFSGPPSRHGQSNNLFSFLIDLVIGKCLARTKYLMFVNYCKYSTLYFSLIGPRQPRPGHHSLKGDPKGSFLERWLRHADWRGVRSQGHIFSFRSQWHWMAGLSQCISSGQKSRSRLKHPRLSKAGRGREWGHGL